MKFAYFFGLAFTVAFALSGCRPDFGPAPGGPSDSDDPPVNHAGEGSSQSAYHFLSGQPCNDDYYTDQTPGATHLTETSSPMRMHQLWIPKSGGGWYRFTMLTKIVADPYSPSYMTEKAFTFSSQFFNSKTTAPPSNLCYEISPSEWPAHWRSFEGSGYCYISPQTCGQYEIDHLYNVSMTGSEGVYYPYVQPPYIQVRGYYDNEYHSPDHSWRTYDGLSWSKDY